MSRTIAIALSGGIDSLVAAALLKDQGHYPIALHFLTGYEARPRQAPGVESHTTELRRQVECKLASLTRQLRIPLHVIDLHSAFQHHVVDYFISEYRRGKTPNPCLVCNPKIKFELLLEKALALGADGIATGHYARIRRDPENCFRLLRGVDPLKDQSYFLARLNQRQLRHVVLPLGDLTKARTRQIAAAKGLHPVTDRESQDVCFVPDSGYREFLAGCPGFDAGPGPVENAAGEVIGTHKGIHYFTIGQRRGINCPAALPYYVVRIDPARNCIVVGHKEDLLTPECQVTQINWIVSAPSQPVHVTTKVRYRHAAVPAMLFPTTQDSARVVFDVPQAAVTPGQGATFFAGEEVLGGGWIQ